MTTARAIYHHNRSLYNDSGVVDFCADQVETHGLMDDEKALFARVQRELEEGAILDVGVGAGRTTRALAAAGKSYVGIDYSKAMVERCRALFPGVDVRLGDATRMEMFEHDRFDVVVFSFNGIDHVVLEDRLRILKEIHRVLRPSGAFIFSTHNLDRPRMSPFALPRLGPSAHRGGSIRGVAHRLARHGRHVLNYLRNRRYEVRDADHALLVDIAYDFRLLVYHTTVEAQIRQLEASGFGDVEVVDVKGNDLRPGQRCEDPWISFLARAR